MFAGVVLVNDACVLCICVGTHVRPDDVNPGAQSVSSMRPDEMNPDNVDRDAKDPDDVNPGAQSMSSMHPDEVIPDDMERDAVDPDNVNQDAKDPDDVNPAAQSVSSMRPDEVNPDDMDRDAVDPDHVNPAAQSVVIALDHMYCNVMSADSVVTPFESVSVDFIVENSYDSTGSLEIPIMSAISRLDTDFAVANGTCDAIHFPKVTNALFSADDKGSSGDKCDDYVENSCDSIVSVEIPVMSAVSKLDTNYVTADNGTSDAIHCPKVTNASFSECDTNSSGDDKDDDDYDPTYSPSEDESVSESDITTDTDSNQEHDSPLVNTGHLDATRSMELEQDVTENDQMHCEVVTHGAMDSATTSVEDNTMAEDDVMDSTSEVHRVVVAVTHNDGGRKYDKVAFCYFCNNPQTKLVRHLKLKHGKEQMVEELISERDKARRQLLIAKLRNLGNHRNNCKVAKAGKGVYVVAHRPKEAVTYDKYIPCRYCFGYYAKSSMWKHSCPLAPVTDSGAKVARVRKGAVSLLSGEGKAACSVGFAGLMSGMRNDEVGTLAAKDSLILKLGQSLCRRFGGDKEQFNYVRSKMRQVARLLLELRKTSGKNMSMSDFIHPATFSAVTAAAKHVAGFKDDSSEYRAPSSALRSGAVIRRLAEIKQAEALERGDQVVVEKSVEFLKLCQLKWPNDVSSVALRNIADRKRSGISIVPLTEDVVKLNTFLSAKATSLLPTVATDASAYMAMTQVVLAKVILFNRKRQGEVSRVTVDDYKKKGKAQNSDAELSLTDFERSLLKVFNRLEIRGKKGRTVPLLLTEEVTSWIDALVAARVTFVSDSNSYLFASNGEDSHFRGSDVLRKFSIECGAKNPGLLTSTRLRKQVASLAQVVCLKDNELDSLATFMGHDLRVHTQFYRLPMDVMQIARISKLFLAAEQGRIGEFAGKELTEITVHPEVEVEAVSDNASEMSDSEPHFTAEQPISSTHEVEVGGSGGGAGICLNNKRKRVMTKRQQWSEAEVETVSDNASEMSDSELNSVAEQATISTHEVEVGGSGDDAGICLKNKRKRVMTNRRPWAEAEKDAVRIYFATAIMTRKLPGKSEIEKFLSESHLDRNWKNVKDHIRNQYLT